MKATVQHLDLPDLVGRFASKRVLVLGDLMMDVYIKGTSSRLSPEAPVPVVDIQEIVHSPGGAANTALNLSALDAHVCFLSVVGNDEAGGRVLKLLNDHGIDTRGVLQRPGRNTLVKSRVVAGTQVLIRFDQGTDTPVDNDTETALMAMLREESHHVDAILVSDYNKGVLTESLIDTLQELRYERGVFIAIDSKRLTAFSRLEPSLVKPNYDEAVAMLGALGPAAARVEQLEARGHEIFAKTNAHLTAVTLDVDGAMIFERDKATCQVEAPFTPFPSVAGAGDTFISAFTLAMISGASVPEAARMATTASNIVVNKTDTSWCSARELKYYFHLREKYVTDLRDLENLCDLYRFQSKRIVFTNGCFDILHSGHVRYLNEAKTLGDVLIVGVNDDESIRRLKGNGRPINPLQDRLQVLAALGAIDHVIPFGDPQDDTPQQLVARIMPDIFVKGADYRRSTLPEADAVERHGGRIVFLDILPDHSTTHIINRIQGEHAAH